MRKLYFILILLLTGQLQAQDIIVKKDGTTILSKVLEVGTIEIKYKKFSNLEGPTYTLSKTEILSVNYENGEKDSFHEESVTECTNENVISDTPTCLNSMYEAFYKATGLVQANIERNPYRYICHRYTHKKYDKGCEIETYGNAKTKKMYTQTYLFVNKKGKKALRPVYKCLSTGPEDKRYNEFYCYYDMTSPLFCDFGGNKFDTTIEDCTINGKECIKFCTTIGESENKHRASWTFEKETKYLVEFTLDKIIKRFMDYTPFGEWILPSRMIIAGDWELTDSEYKFQNIDLDFFETPNSYSRSLTKGK